MLQPASLRHEPEGVVQKGRGSMRQHEYTRWDVLDITNSLLIFLSSAPAVDVHNGKSLGLLLLIIEWSRPGIGLVEHALGAARSVYSKKRTWQFALCSIQ
jgi:hypothetical protein